MQIPNSIIGKDVKLIFSSGGYSNIVNVTKIQSNIITDGNGNKHHVNLKKLACVFEPKSNRYCLKEDLRGKKVENKLLTESRNNDVPF